MPVFHTEGEKARSVTERQSLCRAKYAITLRFILRAAFFTKSPPHNPGPLLTQHNDAGEGHGDGDGVLDGEIFSEEARAPEHGQSAVGRDNDHTCGEVAEHHGHVEDLTDGLADTAEIQVLVTREQGVALDELDPDKKDIHGDFGAHCYVGLRHSLCHGWSAGVAKFIKEHC